MDVQQVLHMNAGEGEASYANISLYPGSMMLRSKPLIEEAIQEILSTEPKFLNIADLGCSSGPNSLLAVTMITDAVHEKCRNSGSPCPEFRVFLNDLPGNDFNSVFKTVPAFYEKLREEKGEGFGPCFISATPGSFYGRLFPSESLHFVFSANSLHWLSQVPPELVRDKGPVNKGNLALGKTSPPSVFQAYLAQFQRDFTAFLKHRSQEVVTGGHMVLTMMSRRIADPFADDCYNNWDDLSEGLTELVAEGLIEEGKMDSYNMPWYEPHIEEVRELIQEEGSFDIVHLDAPFRPNNIDGDESNYHTIDHKFMTNCIRAVTEPVLAYSFGPAVIDKLFEKFEEKLAKRGSVKNAFFLISLARK